MLTFALATLVLAAQPQDITIDTISTVNPVRESHTMVIAGETGWNGLAGTGVNFTWMPHRHIALDTGLGMGLAGLKGGARIRYNLLSSNLTPFFGFGGAYVLGSGDNVVDRKSYKAKINRMSSLQYTGGVSYIDDSGFSVLVALGYSRNSNKDSATRLSGRPSWADINSSENMLGSGPIASIALGYAF